MLMTENELTQALRGLIARELSPTPDARQMTQEIMRRDRVRVRVWASLSLLLWLLGVAGLLLLVVALDRLVIYIRIADAPVEHPANAGKPDPGSLLTPAEINKLWGTSLIHHSIPIIGGSIVALLLAAVSTVLLVFSFRRATLAQINLSLIELSDQLKQLRQPGGT
jgi:hypothetical protein